MEENKQHLEALKDIRQMMKQSNRFLSLSGLSGIFAGIYALAGAYAGNLVIRDYVRSLSDSKVPSDYYALLYKCIFICTIVFFLSITTALYFSSKRAKKTGQKLFDHTAFRLVINLMIPLGAGGVFCLAMLFHADTRVFLVGPAMLIFYGLALVNGSKYSLNDLRYLGCIEILLGLLACFYPGYGLWFWAIGFGFMHIIYGAWMWNRYERN